MHKNIKAVNWAVNTSDDPALILKEFFGDFLLCPHIGINTHKAETLASFQFRDESELVAYFLKSMLDNSC